jgi:hypothetical protein
MHVFALVLAILACGAIAAIGTRFLLTPRPATLDFGVKADDVRALTAIKGVRDITSGVVPLAVLAAAGTTAFGWTLIAAALTPLGDATIVVARGGKLATALGIHGLTAALLLAVGFVLALG